MKENMIGWDVFRKANYVQGLINTTIPGVSSDEVYTMLGHVAHHHYNTRKVGLSEKEILLYDLLLKHKLVPSTVYNWFSLTRTPQDLQQRVRRGTISQKQALRMAMNRKRQQEMSLSLQILESGRNAIRRL
jgi:hypothetical protein